MLRSSVPNNLRSDHKCHEPYIFDKWPPALTPRSCSLDLITCWLEECCSKGEAPDEGWHVTAFCQTWSTLPCLQVAFSFMSHFCLDLEVLSKWWEERASDVRAAPTWVVTLDFMNHKTLFLAASGKKSGIVSGLLHQIKTDAPLLSWPPPGSFAEGKTLGFHGHQHSFPIFALRPSEQEQRSFDDDGATCDSSRPYLRSPATRGPIAEANCSHLTPSSGGNVMKFAFHSKLY